MSGQGQPQGTATRRQYTSASGADTTTWAASGKMADWVQVVGAGSTIVTCEDGTSLTLTTDSAEPNLVMSGPFTAFTSTTATRVRMGNGAIVPLSGQVPVGPVNLAGGSAAVTGVLPATSVQQYGDAGATTFTAAFTAAAGNLYTVNPSGAAFAVNFPAISAAIDGQPIALINVATAGSTATTVTPAGSDSVGNTASGTGATLAGPARGLGQTYTANNRLKIWMVGI